MVHGNRYNDKIGYKSPIAMSVFHCRLVPDHFCSAAGYPAGGTGPDPARSHPEIIESISFISISIHLDFEK